MTTRWMRISTNAVCSFNNFKFDVKQIQLIELIGVKQNRAWESRIYAVDADGNIITIGRARVYAHEFGGDGNPPNNL